jgi:hypothetical protein
MSVKKNVPIDAIQEFVDRVCLEFGGSVEVVDAPPSSDGSVGQVIIILRHEAGVPYCATIPLRNGKPLTPIDLHSLCADLRIAPQLFSPS